MTWQQGILPPKAKSALYQLSTNLHHKEHFRVSELRAVHRCCSRVEADDRREGMQHLQFFSPVANLLRKCMLQVRSGLRDTLYQAVNQPTAPLWEANPHPCENGRRLINLIPCPFSEKTVRDSEGENVYKCTSVFFLLWQRKGGADSTCPPLPWSQQSAEVGGRRGFLQSLCLWGSRRARAQFYDSWPQHNLPFTN